MFPLGRIDCRAIVGHCGVTVKFEEKALAADFKVGILALIMV
jgi:hypothetical protein